MGKQAHGQSDGALWGDAERDAELHELATLLSLASQGEGAWVFALYSSVATRQAVMSALQERVDLPFFEFTFGPEQVNPRDYLDSLPAEARDKPGVVCFCDLELALGRNLVSSVSEAAKPGFSHDDRPLVLGYLDLNRDWFARQPHSLLFWVTGYGRVQVATQAPNFWSRRNNVYDFRVVEPEARAALRGEVLRGLEGGVQFKDVADWRRQVQLYEKLLEEYLEDESPDQAAIADLYGKLGWLHRYTGHYDESRRLFDAQLTAAQAAQDRGRISIVWYNQANLLTLRGDYEGAENLYRRSLATAEELGDRRGVAVSLHDLALMRRSQGRLPEALELLTRSRDLFEQLQLPQDVAREEELIAQIRQQMSEGQGAGGEG